MGAGMLDALLSAYVVTSADGIARVRYNVWRTHRPSMELLRRTISAMEGGKPSAMMRNDALAFWSNLYNASTLSVILNHKPVSSIRDISSKGAIFDPKAYSGPWREKRVSVEGVRLSLDDIEHKQLRPLARDARIHYAINCASIGCPNLQRESWRGDTLHEMLDRAAQSYVNHPRAVLFAPDGRLQVSSIYIWFKEDFGGEQGVLDHLRRYANPALAKRLDGATRIGTHTYDWSLNGV